MDLCFTKRELSWLDDLMPESKKKKEDDKKKKEKEVKRQEFYIYTNTCLIFCTKWHYNGHFMRITSFNT